VSRATETFWKWLLAQLPCVICSRFEYSGVKPSLHHVAPGSSKRSVFGMVPLCHPHHQGPAGFHGMGGKAFLRMYRPPGESEYGLIIWTLEDLATYLRPRLTDFKW